MSYDQFINYLRNVCKRDGGADVWAKNHGISPSYIRDVLAKRRSPGEKICSAAEVEKVISYKVVLK